jgi:hypothetical protein
MVLSGNDTFDLLYENVKRVLKLSGGNSSDSAKEYLDAKQQADEMSTNIATETQVLESLITEQEDLRVALNQLLQDYSEKGGISLEEWSSLQGKLKDEEDKREKINSQKRTLATEILPFIIAAKLVENITPQIREEKEFEAYKSIQTLITAPTFSAMLSSAAHDIGSHDPLRDGETLLEYVKTYFLMERWDGYRPLLGLSDDEEIQVNVILNKLQGLDGSIFRELKEQLNTSVEESKTIRSKLQASDIEHFEEHIKERTRLESDQEILNVKIDHCKANL